MKRGARKRLALPGAAVAVKRIVLFHLLNTRVAQKTPGLTGFVLHAVHHGFLSVAARTGFRSTHGIRGSEVKVMDVTVFSGKGWAPQRFHSHSPSLNTAVIYFGSFEKHRNEFAFRSAEEIEKR